MGHLLFIVLHALMLLFGVWGLVLTIPLHLIYAAVAKPNDARASGYRVPCPACRELVLEGATKCKHCGESLPAPPPRPEEPSGRWGILIALVSVGAIAVVARACGAI